MHTTASILRKNNRQGITKRVVFPKYDKAEEEYRQLRGIRLRNQLKKEKEFRKKLAQQNVFGAHDVYRVLVNPANVVGLNTLATHNRSFRVQLFTLFGDIVALTNNSISPQQPNAISILNALVAENLPFQNIVGDPNVRDVLDMIGALFAFRPFLRPHVSDGSDHDDDGKGDDGKKKGNGGNSNVGDKRQRVAQTLLTVNNRAAN